MEAIYEFEVKDMPVTVAVDARHRRMTRSVHYLTPLHGTAARVPKIWSAKPGWSSPRGDPHQVNGVGLASHQVCTPGNDIHQRSVAAQRSHTSLGMPPASACR
jgi:hypothetical protein